jgi:glycosyltransferase involved in cell wall biosynthesis
MPPRITVVTPSFNQAAYLETTIRSVLGQRYPNLEYFVFDGGSSDGSVEIIRRYASELAHWTSAPDGGQAAAINIGFGRATGEILCWLNSDDFHLPDALGRMAAHLGARTAEPAIAYGSCVFFDEEGSTRRIEPPHPHNRARLRRCDPIVQPSAFWTAAAWRAVGPLDDSMHFAFDWEWFLRADQKGCRFQPVPDLLAAYRIHAAHKSGSGGDKRRDEILRVMRAHSEARTVEMFEWWRAHPQLWPAMRRWSGYRWLKLPRFVATLLCPPLWFAPWRFQKDELLDCFNML